MNREQFEKVLQSHLSNESNGRSYVFGEMLLPMILSMLTGVFQNCLGNLTPSQVAQQAVEPAAWQVNQMRIKVCRELYEGKWKDYRADDGERIVRAIFATTKAVGAVDLAAVIENQQQTDWSA